MTDLHGESIDDLSKIQITIQYRVYTSIKCSFRACQKYVLTELV